MSKLIIEGESLREILSWPVEYFDELVLIDDPIVLSIGSAEVLGQFAVIDNELLVELAQIDGGGEGILPAIARIAKYVASLKSITVINCVVHAINCAQPNLKLRAHLEKTGFVIKNVPGKGEAYYKQIKTA
jgi:hypothetical protein